MNESNFFVDVSGNLDLYKYKIALEEVDFAKIEEEKGLQLKERLSKFENVITLKEAQALAKQIIPTVQEEYQFKAGNATCTVINKADRLRISFNSDKEFICYDFV